VTSGFNCIKSKTERQNVSVRNNIPKETARFETLFELHQISPTRNKSTQKAKAPIRVNPNCPTGL
jgi:hypothetical protein